MKLQTLELASMALNIRITELEARENRGGTGAADLKLSYREALHEVNEELYRKERGKEND